MVAPRTARSLDPVDAAYVAGLIDGEGTITLIRKHRGESRQLSLSISSTEKPLLEFVLTAAGVGKITSKVRYRQHHRQSFTYAVYNRQALQLLTQVAPYLRSYKAERCRLILENYIALTPRNGKYTAELRQRRTNFEQAVLSIQP